MKKLIAILTASACTLAVIAHAAKPPDQGNAKADKKAAPKTKAVAPKVQAAPKQKVAPPPQQQRNIPKANVKSKAPKKERTAPAVAPRTDADVTKVESRKVKPDKAPKLQTEKAPDATSVVADDKLRKNINPSGKIKKLEPAAIQKIQAQHKNFKAQPKPAIASVQFNPNYRIEAAQNWSGPQYEVFRSYQPQWHDQTWYRSRYVDNLSLIAGGWYFWEAGYWYPAWGYDDSAAYYPYDGPIYVGPNPRPFDQVVADVQAVLQEQGYYTGEIDGLVGPLTRDALAAYQQAEGLPPTASIDRPTLESLGLS